MDRYLVWVLLGCACMLVVGAYVVAGLLQQRMIYHPNATYALPEALGLKGVQEIRLPVAGGDTVVAWWAKAPPGRPTVLYFHGNAGSLADRRERVAGYQAYGFGLFMLAYRGYSGSTGSPSEQHNVADARLAYEYLVKSGVPTRDVVIYGESLGSGVAVQVAVQRPPLGVVLDAPYTSVVDLGQRRFPWLPVSLLMHQRYETSRYIGQLKVPLLIVHGENDEIIPVEMGKRVFGLAGSPSKQMAVIPGAGHADHYLHGSYDTIFAWINRLWADRASSQ